MPGPAYATVEDYLAAQPEPLRAALATVREVLRAELPGAVERISYQIPSLRWMGRNALFYAGYPRHYAVYPVSPALHDALGDELEPYLSGKATLRFDPALPVPVDLLRRVGLARRLELSALPRVGRKRSGPG